MSNLAVKVPFKAPKIDESKVIKICQACEMCAWCPLLYACLIVSDKELDNNA